MHHSITMRKRGVCEGQGQYRPDGRRLVAQVISELVDVSAWV